MKTEGKNRRGYIIFHFNTGLWDGFYFNKADALEMQKYFSEEYHGTWGALQSAADVLGAKGDHGPINDNMWHRGPNSHLLLPYKKVAGE